MPYGVARYIGQITLHSQHFLLRFPYQVIGPTGVVERETHHLDFGKPNNVILHQRTPQQVYKGL